MQLIFLLINVASYTICTLNDKKTVSRGGLSGSEFTFFISASTAAFMLPCLPFLHLRAALCPQTFGISALLVANKLCEFYTAAVCLSVLSAFEVKAWLGLAMFLSYGADCAIFGEAPSAAKLACLPFALAGLALIASGSGDTNGSGGRRKLTRGELLRLIPAMALYIFANFSYGLIMRAGEPYLSKNTGLFISMLALTAIMAVAIFPKRAEGGLLKRLYLANERPCDYAVFKKMLLIVFLTRLPNIAGLLAENALIGMSLTIYSFVQPLILVTLFFITIAKRERFTAKNLLGSMMCVGAIAMFQIFSII